MPDVQILSREQIAQQADMALYVALTTGREPVNPYPAGSDAHAAFEASLERYSLQHVPDAEASA